MGIRTMVKLYCYNGYYTTIYLDEIKSMEQNGAYWFIEMENGEILKDCNMAVITNDPCESVRYL